MEYDLSNPTEATISANQPNLTKEFIPSLGVTEIPDFETFSLDPDKYLSQVTDPSTMDMQTEEPTQEVDAMQNEIQPDTLPPVDETTQDIQTQEGGEDMPGAEDSVQGSGETVQDEQEKETLQ